MTLTQKGARYITDNDDMAKVRGFLGKAWPAALQVALEASRYLSF
jgi:hypothetical protein